MATARRGKAAVLGSPVSHSLSPRLHGFWLKKYGIEGSYEAIDVRPDKLRETLRRLVNHSYIGCNLTLPLKEAALEYMDEIDDVARVIGAVNTVVIDDAGKLRGYNTDAYGFMANLNSASGNKMWDKALVMGAGGAAKAVCYGLIQQGSHIILANRTLDRAEKLAAIFPEKITVCEEAEVYQYINIVDLVVNTTSVGMSGNKLPADIRLDMLPLHVWVADIVYNPLKTKLLTFFEERKNPVVTGLGMLLYQAQPAFEAWFGVRPDVDRALYDYVGEAIK